MNRSYKSIWNQALGAWVAASEVARTRGKRSKSLLLTATIAAVTGFHMAPATAADLWTSGACRFNVTGGGVLGISAASGYTEQQCAAALIGSGATGWGIGEGATTPVVGIVNSGDRVDFVSGDSGNTAVDVTKTATDAGEQFAVTIKSARSPMQYTTTNIAAGGNIANVDQFTPTNFVTLVGVGTNAVTINNVAPAVLSADSLQAVNGSQLFALQEWVNKGWNLTTGQSGTGTVTGTTVASVTPTKTVTLTAGDNIAITQNATNVTIATKADVAFNSVTANTVTVGPVTIGSAGINAGDTKITGVADGAISQDSTDAVNGSQLWDLQQTAGAGWNLQANGGTPTNIAPRGTVNVVNGSNTTAVLEGNQLKINVVDNPTFSGPVTMNGGATVSNNLTVTNGTTVDMGGNKITNVAPGTNGTDAVNLNQLTQATKGLTNIDNRLNDLDKEARAGTASAMATAGLPQAYLPGKSMLAVAGSTYRGATGVALGVSTITDNGKWVIKGSVNTNNKGHVGATLGAGYQW